MSQPKAPQEVDHGNDVLDCVAEDTPEVDPDSIVVPVSQLLATRAVDPEGIVVPVSQLHATRAVDRDSNARANHPNATREVDLLLLIMKPG